MGNQPYAGPHDAPRPRNHLWLGVSSSRRADGKILLKESSKDTEIVERDWSLDELATMVASTPEVVCRVLHQFADEGLLGITRTRITLHDREGLERLVKMN